MDVPRVFGDFQNSDVDGRVRMNCNGTFSDLKRLGITLREGMRIVVYDEEIEASARIEYSTTEHIWVAVYDRVRQISSRDDFP